MIEPTAAETAASTWEQEIRDLEEQARRAFLERDVAGMDQLLADGYVVNSPLGQVLDKERMLELLRTGRIGHSSYEIEVERVVRHGDVVVVMGRDTVVNPPDRAVVRRRFTDVWERQHGAWRSIARHAHVVAREPAV